MSKRTLVCKFTHHLCVELFFSGTHYCTLLAKGVAVAPDKASVTLADSHVSRSSDSHFLYLSDKLKWPTSSSARLIFFGFSLHLHFKIQMKQAIRGSFKGGCDHPCVGERGPGGYAPKSGDSQRLTSMNIKKHSLVA